MRFPLLVLLGFAAGAAVAAEGRRVASAPADIALGSRVIHLQPGGKAPVVAAWLEPAAGKSRTVAIIDATDAAAPRERTRFELDGGMAIALDDSGTRALAWLSLEPSKPGQDRRHAAVALDVGKPGPPRQVWRREFTARQVGLANNASAYYFVARSPTDAMGGGSLSVFYADDRSHVSLAVPGGATDFVLSPNGRYVAWYDIAATISELDAKRPAQFTQGYPAEPHVCLIAALDGGTLIGGDAQLPRLHAYAPSDGLPRIASLPLDDRTGTGSCRVASVGRSGETLYLRDDQTLTKVDLSDARAPRRVERWTLDGYGSRIAIAGDTLFASDPVKADVLVVTPIVAGTQIPSRPFDWRALEQAHAAAMERYQAQTREGQILAELNLRMSLEKAGISAAASASPGSFPKTRAASMLHDYGRLLGLQSQQAESVFRRAIELDPELAAAHFGLAEVLRSQLGSVSDWERKKARKREAEQAYRQFLALGGKVPSIVSDFLRDDWETAKPSNLCAAVAKLATQGRLSEVLSDSGQAIPVGTRRVDVYFMSEGTAHVPTYRAVDAATGETISSEIATPVDPESLWGGDSLGLLVYAGRHHMLHSNDAKHPRTSIALDGTSACSFANRTTEVLDQETENAGLCLRILRGERPEALAFDDPAWMTRAEVTQRFRDGGITGARTLDALNDGNPITVARVGVSSGAGAGCEQTFFELMDRDATRFETGPSRDLLWKLQAGQPDNRYPLQCGNDPRFFEFDGRVLFETRPMRWPPADTSDQYHLVNEVDGGRVVETCRFRFVTETSWQAVDPASLSHRDAAE